MIDAHGQYQTVSLADPAARSTTGQGAGVDVKDYDGIVGILLHSAAGTGTAPTLDVTLEESDDNSTFTAASGAVTFTQVTDAAASLQYAACDVSKLKRYIRAKYSINGSSPSFTFSVALIGWKQDE